MNPENPKFKTPRSEQIDLNAQEVFLGVNPNKELKRRERERIIGAITTAILFLTSYVGSQSLLRSSDELFNFFKADGAYDSPPTSAPMLDRVEIIPAEPSEDALLIGDTFDGLLGSSGYNLTYDPLKIQEHLEENQAVIITLDQMRPRDDDPIRSGSLIVSSQEDMLLQDNDAYKEIDLKIPDPFARIGDGRLTDFKPVSIEDAVWPVTVDGLALEAQQPATVSITVVESNGSELNVVSNESTTVSMRPNTACANGDKFTSEVTLKPSQHDVVCGMFQEYGALIDDKYALYLNAASHRGEAGDSANFSPPSINITYPYIGGQEVTAEDVKRTFLHEAIHVAHGEARFDLLLVGKIKLAYKFISANTDYKMPPHSEINTFKSSPAEIEPIWAIITESQYIEEPSKHGHPWDNDSEMLASTTAVLANYPDEFIEKYENLKPLQQAAIRNAVSVSVQLIEKYTADVAAIIPEWETIKTALDL